MQGAGPTFRPPAAGREEGRLDALRTAAALVLAGRGGGPVDLAGLSADALLALIAGRTGG